MELANGEVYAAVLSLTELMKKDFPVSVSYWLARLAKKLDPIYKSIDEVRSRLVEKHGAKDEKTGQLSVSDKMPTWNDFLVEFNELMNQHIDVDVEPIKLPIVIPQKVRGEEVSLSSEILMKIAPFIIIEGLDLKED